MQYTLEIEVNTPVSDLMKLISHPDDLDKRMKRIKSYRLTKGISGEKGSQHQINFQWETVTETIVDQDLPNSCEICYESNFVTNRVKNRFIPLSDTQSKLISEQSFEFKGLLKLAKFLIPSSAFKNGSKKHLEYLKSVLESQNILD